ncbi:MAG: hypothetical protein VX966_01960 [Chloroflexota bacterium]|nr:hypothetical protein [Chloroflexota bacterium]
MSKSKWVSVGDLVRIKPLPQKQKSSSIWKTNTSQSMVGIVVEEDPRSELQILVGQCLTVKLGNGELVTLSSNMLEIIKKGVPSHD